MIVNFFYNEILFRDQIPHNSPSNQVERPDWMVGIHTKTFFYVF